jgi:hypothetical protein
MKLKNINRKFIVGTKKRTQIKHLLNIYLKPNEQITFISKKNREYDFVKKEWGYYATQSINARLKKFKFLTCLVRNKITKRRFVLVVYKEKKLLFKKYLKKENMKILQWL